MIEVIAQFEFPPAAYPAIEGVTGDALAVAWQRIEAYTAHRFAARQVMWMIESTDADWTPPLRPVVSLTAGIWSGDGYAPVTLALAPGGWHLPCGRLEITATVGAGPVPAVVAQAVKRLADYLSAATGQPPGARSWSQSIGELSESGSADPAAQARAIQNSGAADLLRPYRRAH